MALPLRQPYAPMDAMSVDEIPVGKNWQYEAKWDGFQCLVFRDGGTIELQSKSGQSLTRYFPELVAAVSALKARQFVRLVAQRLGPPGLAPVKPGGAISFSNRRNGSRSNRGWSWKSVTTTSAAAASAMAPGFCAGVPARHRASAPRSRSRCRSRRIC